MGNSGKIGMRILQRSTGRGISLGQQLQRPIELMTPYEVEANAYQSDFLVQPKQRISMV